MIRPGRITLAVLFVLLLPSLAAAQRDTRETREATKFIGLAMTRSAPEEQEAQYRQAMTHLREAMQKDADNAKVWLLAGTTLAALGEVEEADQAFRRAVELHPAYAEDVEGERESAWVHLFNQGIEHMDAQRYPDAIRAMEGAQLIYPSRPEALLNLGALYSNAGETQKAVEALRQAIEITGGPMVERLDEEQKAEWARFRVLATSNIAQIMSQRGIDDFQAERFDSAASAFAQATEVNPHARDYYFNHAQALWALATPLEEQYEAAPDAQKAELRAQLSALYEKIQQNTAKAREYDPNNEALYLISARTHRMEGEIAADEAARTAAQQRAMRLLEAHNELGVTLDNVGVQTGDEGSATIIGQLKNVKLAENAPVTITFTLLGLDGNAVGTQAITVNAPAPDATTEFEQPTTVTGTVAGWRYTIGS
jgi:tetratricopeptide (TPR) repeat protein